MARRIAWLVAATTSAVVVAFIVPLCFLVANLAEDRATLHRLLQTLPVREREVLRLRFEHDLTQAEIGERIGVSQMQVSRLIRQSITRLRSAARVAGDAD